MVIQSDGTVAEDRSEPFDIRDMTQGALALVLVVGCFVAQLTQGDIPDILGALAASVVAYYFGHASGVTAARSYNQGAALGVVAAQTVVPQASERKGQS